MAETGNLYGRTQVRRRHAREVAVDDTPHFPRQPSFAPAPPAVAGAFGEVPPLKLHVLESMEATRTIWRSFERRALASPFQTHVWLSTWFDTVGEAAGVSPVIVFGYDQSERLSLLMPLGVTSAKGLKILSWLGDGMAGYNAPLVDPSLLSRFGPQAVDFIWQSVIGHLGKIDVVRLQRQPKMLGPFPNPFIHGCKSADAVGGRILPLPSTWPEFAARHIGEGRHTSADFARHLRRRGRLTIGLNLPSQARSRVVERILTAARSRPGRRSGGAPMVQGGVAAFFKTLALTESTGLVSISAVNIDDEMVAASIGYIHGNQYYLSVISLEDSEDGRAAAGLLCEELIRSCIVQGIKAIDFLGGTAVFPQWTRDPMPLFELVSRRTPMGHLASGMDIMRRAVGLGGRDRSMTGGARLTFAQKSDGT